MKGEKFEEEIEESEEETESSTGDKILSSIVSRIKKMMGFRSEHGLIGDDRKELRNDVAREFESVYSGVKEKANALKM